MRSPHLPHPVSGALTTQVCEPQMCPAPQRDRVSSDFISVGFNINSGWNPETHPPERTGACVRSFPRPPQCRARGTMLHAARPVCEQTGGGQLPPQGTALLLCFLTVSGPKTTAGSPRLAPRGVRGWAGAGGLGPCKKAPARGSQEARVVPVPPAPNLQALAGLSQWDAPKGRGAEGSVPSTGTRWARDIPACVLHHSSTQRLGTKALG